MIVRAPLPLARLVRGFIVELAGFRRASLRAMHMIEWLSLVDAGKPGVSAKIAHMHRVMLGREDGIQADVGAALDAVDFAFPPGSWGPPALVAWASQSTRDYVATCDREGREPTQAHVRYVNALSRVGLGHCMVRVTNDLAVTLGRAMAIGRGRPKGGLPRDKHEIIAGALSTLLAEEVSRNTVEKCLKAGRRKKRT